MRTIAGAKPTSLQWISPNELEISPGNLYYHFKGKRSWLRELYEQLRLRYRNLATDSRSAEASLEEHWLYLYVMLEHIFNYRFFLRNTTDLLHKYGGIDKRFRASWWKSSISGYTGCWIACWRKAAGG